jgi:hypothetical protein
MRLSTSEIQGHDVDELEAMERATLNSLVGKQAGEQPADLPAARPSVAGAGSVRYVQVTLIIDQTIDTIGYVLI